MSEDRLNSGIQTVALIFSTWITALCIGLTDVPWYGIALFGTFGVALSEAIYQTKAAKKEQEDA